MVDITRTQDQGVQQTMQTLYKDMGDGTHALAVYAQRLSTEPMPVTPNSWRWLGGEVITPGGASAAATLPAGTTIFQVAPEGEDMYYRINGTPASTLSPGYVADGGRELVGPLNNLNSLTVYMAGVNIIHLQYFREA